MIYIMNHLMKPWTLDSSREYIYILEPCDLEKKLDLWNIF